MKKWALATIAIFFGCSFLFSQDLVEVAKREKERRESLKKSSSIVVTNSDLKKSETRESATIVSPKISPQKSLDTRPSQTPPSRTISATPQTPNLDQVDQIDMRGYNQTFAINVLDFNELVRNPQWALNKPDGQFAEISILGVLDLEISAKNGPGDDIAVYARQIGAKAMMPGGEEEGGIPELSADYQYWEGLWYGVLAMGEQGEWIALGKGTGTDSPEKFDFGNLSSVKKIRIMFRPHSNPDLPQKTNRRQPRESTFGIDAVEALHRQ